MIHKRLFEEIKSTYLKRSMLAVCIMMLLWLCVTAHNTWATYVSSDSVGTQGIQSAQYEVAGALYMLSGEKEERVSTMQTPDENGEYSLAAGKVYQFRVHGIGNVSTGYCVLDFNQGTAYKYLTLVPSQTETIVNILPAADCSFSYSYSWGSAPGVTLTEGIEYIVQTQETELAKVVVGADILEDEMKDQTEAEDTVDENDAEDGAEKEEETTEENENTSEDTTDITDGDAGSSGNETGATDQGTGSGETGDAENDENVTTNPEGTDNNQVENPESTDNSGGNTDENSSQSETGTAGTDEDLIAPGEQ